MMLATRRAAAALPTRQQQRALRAVPVLGARRLAVRVRAEGPEDKTRHGGGGPLGGGGGGGGSGPTKDLSDISRPSEISLKAEPAFEAPPLLPAFSRRREVWAGRLAMVGIAATAAWEILTPAHPGPMGITAALTGWSIPTVKLVFAGFVAHGLLGLLWPGAPTFSPSNQRDAARRPDGPPSVAINPLMRPAAFLGCSPHFGFTKANELLHGRLAMLGFMAALVNEASTGLGPIGQVAWWMGSTQPGEGWYHNAGVALLSFAALMAAAAYASGHAGTMQGEDDIY